MDEAFIRRILVETQKNILGEALQPCSLDPVTGFYRDDCCHTGPEDFGLHTVCAEMTSEFLAFSKARGNDLSAANFDTGFPGLKPGDRWCLCAARWREALLAGVAPPIVLASTNAITLEVVSFTDLKKHALDMA